MVAPRDLGDLVALRRDGSLSGAAKRRGVAVSTISRRIAALERALKLRLVDRETGGARLTPFGEEIAALAEPIADQLARVERAAEHMRGAGSRMSIRVSATEFVVSEILAPALPKLWALGARFPVQIEAELEVVSLARRDADLAIRTAKPVGSTLYIRKLGVAENRLYAARSYLDGRDPASLDLKAERLIVYSGLYGRLPEQDWVTHAGLDDAVVLRTGSTRAQLQATIAGGGIALLPVAFARKYPELIPVPLARPPRPRIPWLVVHRDLRRDPRIRLVQDWIFQAFEVFRT